MPDLSFRVRTDDNLGISGAAIVTRSSGRKSNPRTTAPEKTGPCGLPCIYCPFPNYCVTYEKGFGIPLDPDD